VANFKLRGFGGEGYEQRCKPQDAGRPDCRQVEASLPAAPADSGIREVLDEGNAFFDLIWPDCAAWPAAPSQADVVTDTGSSCDRQQ